jgi:DNA mismatch endonuclease (patch repair protein)
MDKYPPKKRSAIMSSIRSTGNEATERRLARLLAELKLKGWRRHSRLLPGCPDFYLSSRKLAIFVDGCFWHGCPRHFKLPRTNTSFWRAKIERNRARRTAVRRNLTSMGWKVVRVWQHQLRGAAIVRLKRRLAAISKNGLR